MLIEYLSIQSGIFGPCLDRALKASLPGSGGMSVVRSGVFMSVPDLTNISSTALMTRYRQHSNFASRPAGTFRICPRETRTSSSVGAVPIVPPFLDCAREKREQMKFCLAACRVPARHKTLSSGTRLFAKGANQSVVRCYAAILASQKSPQPSLARQMRMAIMLSAFLTRQAAPGFFIRPPTTDLFPLSMTPEPTGRSLLMASRYSNCPGRLVK